VVTLFHRDAWLEQYLGDAEAVLASLPAESVHCVVTSPPYWNLRDYGVAGQLGLELTPELYVDRLVAIFREVRRVLRSDGTVWLNLGDTYSAGGRSSYDQATPNRGNRASARAPRHSAGLKPKDLVGIPWMVAFALRADGWYLRRDVIWSKPNPMPESAEDRPSTSHEYLFLLTRSERYFYDAEAIREAATSGPSDLRKMAEALPRIGGLVLEQDDRHLKASARTNVGRKRSVGGAPLRIPTGWNAGATEADRDGRFAGGVAAVDARPGRSKRSVWTIATEPFPGAHFATFPTKLVEPCILAGTSARGVCPACGAPWIRELATEYSAITDNSDVEGEALAVGRQFRERAVRSSSTTGWRPSCSHSAGLEPDDLDVIVSPLVTVREGAEADPVDGRASGTRRRGLDRTRMADEGQRPMARFEQRAYARQLRALLRPDLEALAAEAGPAFAHYLRTDRAGARPIPGSLLEAWIARGVLEPVSLPELVAEQPVPATVLDPFGGSGTTALVAERLGRRAILIDVSADYAAMALERVAVGRRDGSGAAIDMPLPAPDDSLWAEVVS
jgi:DNA modification methylase